MIVYFVNTLQRRKYVVPRWVADLLVTMKVWEYGMVPYHTLSIFVFRASLDGFEWV